MQLYRHFVSQSNEFCSHNPLCCFSTSVCCRRRCFYFAIDSVRKLLDTPSYVTACFMVLTANQPVKKFPAFYERRRFIIVFTRIPLPWATWIQSTSPHLIYLRFILILSSHKWSLSSLQVFGPKFRTHFSSFLCVPQAPPMSTSLMFPGRDNNI
jgi:hypothetical protein